MLNALKIISHLARGLSKRFLDSCAVVDDSSELTSDEKLLQLQIKKNMAEQFKPTMFGFPSHPIFFQL